MFDPIKDVVSGKEYQEVSPRWSYQAFLRNEVLPRLSQQFSEGKLTVLELGCGEESVFNSIDCSNLDILAIDIREDLIVRAKASGGPAQIKYEVGDATKFLQEESYHLVVDAHCFHCITDQKKRSEALKNIFSSLKGGAILAMESMIYPEDFRIDFDYCLDEQYTLSHLSWDEQGNMVETPVRKIVPSIMLEEELIGTGFAIKYLMAHSHLKVIPVAERTLPSQYDPDLCQIICIKEEGATT